MTIQNGKHLLLTNYQESKRQVGFYCSYSVVQKKFTLFEIPASFLPSKMASPCTANWP